MNPDEIKAAVGEVSAALGIGLLIADGAVKAQPTDKATMTAGRDAFNALRRHLERLTPRDDAAAARQTQNLSF